jgi:hypothetical protein
VEVEAWGRPEVAACAAVAAQARPEQTVRARKRLFGRLDMEDLRKFSARLY